MSKRKFHSSTELRDLSIRGCAKDLRLRRVLSLGSDTKGLESSGNRGDGVGSWEATSAGGGGGKDLVRDSKIKDKDKDAAKDCEKDSNAAGGTNKAGFQPKGILKRPNRSACDMDNSIQRTPPESVIAFDTASANSCQPRSRVRFAPCTRQKLVQVPGSVSYRRLLPYLKKIDKDEVEASTEEQKVTSNLDSQNSILTETLDFAEIPASNTPNSGKAEEIITPNSVSTVSQSIEMPKENILSNSTNLPIEPELPLDDSIQAMEILCSPQLVPSVSSVQETLTVDELASGNFDKRDEVATSTKMQENRSDKTRNCQGGCICLNCVLFRIRAEKSIEFSAKQLDEADEIIRGLVTEVCSLRHILQKSIGKSCSDCSQIYKDELIKMTCERASLTENLATMRMKQMFMNLDTHCKPQEGSVDFSDSINQKTIQSPEADPKEYS